MVYQLMFAIITPALIYWRFRREDEVQRHDCCSCAVVAHRLRAHGAHGLGQRRPAERLSRRTFSRLSILPAARSCTLPSGVSALVCALYLGKRVGFPQEPMPPHSVVLSLIGACMLWVGWFGFNAGSALAAGSLATSAFVATHFAAAAATIGWGGTEWMVMGRPSALGAISGAVAGLVAITPAAGFVSPMPALLIGLVAGVVCFFMVSKVKAAFGYDDSLDAFGVHGVGGTLGALLTGVFASKLVNPVFKDAHGNLLGSGWIDGNFISCSTS